MENEKYMKIALNEAKRAFKKNDVPVGAVIVKNGKVLSKAHNQKQLKKNAILHAEIIAIKRACRKVKSWHLEECTLYVTLEPCLMCAGAIIQSRIGKVVYATPSIKFGYIESTKIMKDKKNNYIPIIESDVCKLESVQLLKKFFKNKRD